MSFIYDLSLHVDPRGRIKKINWVNPHLRQHYEGLWNNFVGVELESISSLVFSADGESLRWNNEAFRCQKETFENGEVLLFLKKGVDRENIFKCALDTLEESIQIYDEFSNIVYFNRTGRETVGILDNPEGMNLLEVFDVEEDDSTTLEALRMKAPVKNRFRHYHSRQGKELFTVNSAFPIICDGQIIGALALEENIAVISKKAEQLEQLQNAMREKMAAAAAHPRKTGYTLQDLVGHHPRLQAVKELAAKVARQESNVLIVGETGTGKEILAQSLHCASARSKGPFIALNCAAMPENLIESILFGTVKGSFTGSYDKAGLLEEADKGTVFLDELNSMSLGMQAKVLRALQEGTFRRVGGNREYKIDVRVISTCNESPFLLMEQKKLRSDLFYRLATIILEIPPLRERIEDIGELVRHHIAQISPSYAFPFREIEPEALWQMQQYSWPGNVRELFHAVEYAMNVASDDMFRRKYLPTYCLRGQICEGKNENVFGGDEKSAASMGTLQEQVEIFEADIIEKTLKRHFGNISETARHLGLQRQSLQYRIRKYGIVN